VNSVFVTGARGQVTGLDLIVIKQEPGGGH